MAGNRNSQPNLRSSVGLCHQTTWPPWWSYGGTVPVPFRYIQFISLPNITANNWVARRHPRNPRRPTTPPPPVVPLESLCWEIDSVRAYRVVEKESIRETQYLVRWADTWISTLLLESADYPWEIEDILTEIESSDGHFSTTFCLARWKDSWESVNDLDNATEAIAAYLTRRV